MNQPCSAVTTGTGDAASKPHGVSSTSTSTSAASTYPRVCCSNVSFDSNSPLLPTSSTNHEASNDGANWQRYVSPPNETSEPQSQPDSRIVTDKDIRERPVFYTAFCRITTKEGKIATGYHYTGGLIVSNSHVFPNLEGLVGARFEFRHPMNAGQWQTFTYNKSNAIAASTTIRFQNMVNLTGLLDCDVVLIWMVEVADCDSISIGRLPRASRVSDPGMTVNGQVPISVLHFGYRSDNVGDTHPLQVSHGFVSPTTNNAIHYPFFQHTGHTRPGSSGGAVLDYQDRLLGMSIGGDLNNLAKNIAIVYFNDGCVKPQFQALGYYARNRNETCEPFFSLTHGSFGTLAPLRDTFNHIQQNFVSLDHFLEGSPRIDVNFFNQQLKGISNLFAEQNTSVVLHTPFTGFLYFARVEEPLTHVSTYLEEDFQHWAPFTFDVPKGKRTPLGRTKLLELVTAFANTAPTASPVRTLLGLMRSSEYRVTVTCNAHTGGNPNAELPDHRLHVTMQIFDANGNYVTTTHLQFKDNTYNILYATQLQKFSTAHGQ